MTENNHRLYDYLASHDRIPKKREGLIRKRQRTFDEMVEFVKSEANRADRSKSMERLGLMKTEQQVQEYLNTYLHLTFAVDGWWAKRVVELMKAGKLDEINEVEQMTQSYDSGKH